MTDGHKRQMIRRCRLVEFYRNRVDAHAKEHQLLIALSEFSEAEAVWRSIGRSAERLVKAETMLVELVDSGQN